jgi:hypothetical protein
MSSHTLLGDSNDENEVCACESETECLIITAQEALIVLRVIAQYYNTHMVLMGN